MEPNHKKQQKEEESYNLSILLEDGSFHSIVTTKKKLSLQFEYFNTMFKNDSFIESVTNSIHLKFDLNISNEYKKEYTHFFLNDELPSDNIFALYEINKIIDYFQELKYKQKIQSIIEKLISEIVVIEEHNKLEEYCYLIFLSIEYTICLKPFFIKLKPFENLSLEIQEICEKELSKDQYLLFLFDWKTTITVDKPNESLIDPFSIIENKYKNPKIPLTLKTNVSLKEDIDLICCNKDIFMNGINDIFKDKDFPWYSNENKTTGVVIAGGSILSLLCQTKDIIEYNNNNKDWDLYIWGDDTTEMSHYFMKVASYCYKELTKNGEICRIVYELSLVSLITKNVTIQIIATDFIHPYFIVKDFDMDYVRCFYQNGNVFITFDCYKSLLYRTCFNCMFSTGITRYWKALNKGFHIAVDNILLISKLNDRYYFSKEKVYDEYMKIFKNQDGLEFLKKLFDISSIKNILLKYNFDDLGYLKEYNIDSIKELETTFNYTPLKRDSEYLENQSSTIIIKDTKDIENLKYLNEITLHKYTGSTYKLNINDKCINLIFTIKNAIVLKSFIKDTRIIIHLLLEEEKHSDIIKILKTLDNINIHSDNLFKKLKTMKKDNKDIYYTNITIHYCGGISVMDKNNQLSIITNINKENISEFINEGTELTLKIELKEAQSFDNNYGYEDCPEHVKQLLFNVNSTTIH